MPPSGPGICPMAPNLKYSESAQFARHFGTKHAILGISTYSREQLQGLDKNSMIFVFVILLSFLISFYDLISRTPRGKNTRFNLTQFMKAW